MTNSTVVVQSDPPSQDLRLAPEHPAADSEQNSVLWFGMLGPPLLALLNLQLSYTLTPVACRDGTTVWMQIITALILLATVGAGVGAARRVHREWLRDTVISRPGFMAMLGVLESTLFSTVIVAQWVPHAFIGPC